MAENTEEKKPDINEENNVRRGGGLERGRLKKVLGIGAAAIVSLIFVVSNVKSSSKSKDKIGAEGEAKNISAPNELLSQSEAAKKRMAEQQTAAGNAVLNGNNEYLSPDERQANDMAGFYGAGAANGGYGNNNYSGYGNNNNGGYNPSADPSSPYYNPAAAGNGNNSGYQNYSGYQGGGSGQNDPLRTALESSLVPDIQGNLKTRNQPPPATEEKKENNYMDMLNNSLAAVSGNPRGNYDYDLQNNQDDKNKFYQSGQQGGTAITGRLIEPCTIWPGTIIPGVLITAVNTDLPGDIMARVSQNVYDSRYGKHLLIPQGTILLAKYNSRISYAQARVQIAWNYLIRPDGLEIPLGGMNGVDEKGMSGQGGDYHENWFQYAKAAGIIAMYSFANAKLTQLAGVQQVAADGTTPATDQVSDAIGKNIVEKALNVQPTITIDAGTQINIMTNKSIMIPPFENFPVTQKYTLKK